MTLSLPSLVFWMLLAITVFAIVSRLVRIPYPIVMLIGGALIALIPGLKPVTLAPDVVFLVLLPLLLFSGGWRTDFRRSKELLSPILQLALGLVLLTTVVVAWIAHRWMGLPLASAFVLGAILSPSDAIATEAIAEGVAFPSRAQTILSGESLVNDAAALVIYGFAVAAVSTGEFSLGPAALDFVYVVVAGIGLGLLIAWIMYCVARVIRKAKLNDELMGILLSLVTPFLTYLPAQAAHASGVLAAVSGGVFLTSRSGRIFNAEQRIALNGVWAAINFALNGFAFILVGLQLRSVLAQLAAYRASTLLLYAFGIAGVIAALRIASVMAGGYLRWRLNWAKGRRVDPVPRWGDYFITGWSGMRGIVTLAGALAVPTLTTAGDPFPGRALIIYLAFTTIVITLVGQGLTLPFIVRRLGGANQDEYVRELAFAQLRTASAGRERLRELETHITTTTERQAAGRLAGLLDRRIARANAVLDGHPTTEPASDFKPFDDQLHRAVCNAERAALEAMRERGEIGDRAFHQTEHGIDLAESLLKG